MNPVNLACRAATGAATVAATGRCVWLGYRIREHGLLKVFLPDHSSSHQNSDIVRASTTFDS